MEDEMFEPIEKSPSASSLLKALSHHYVTNAVVAFLFCITGPLAIILDVSIHGGLDQADIVSWVFAGYTLGGILTIFVSYLYRQPIALAWTIPGAVLLKSSLDHLSFNEIIGSYVVTALLILILGLTGAAKRWMKYIPLPIVMGMVAGVFLPFGLNIVTAFNKSFYIALYSLIFYLIFSFFPNLGRMVPPILASLLAGLVTAILTGNFVVQGETSTYFVVPKIYTPTFSVQSLVELVLPLTITVIAIQNAQGIAILRAAEFNPPINAMTIACGFGSLIYALFGSVPTCVTGPVNGILNTSGKKQHRFIAAIIFGFLLIIFGIFSPVAIKFALAIPQSFIGMLGGLAMIRVLQGSFIEAFKAKFSLGALTSFIVTVSGVTIYNIGAPFWGLVFGFIASLLLERHEFKKINKYQ
jgi:benzoate membrane transport protein